MTSAVVAMIKCLSAKELLRDLANYLIALWAWRAVEVTPVSLKVFSASEVRRVGSKKNCGISLLVKMTMVGM